MTNRQDIVDQFTRIAAERVLVKDGPYGTMVQAHALDEAGFRGDRFADFGHDLKGNNDILNITQAAIVRDICDQYLDAGADIVATNTFNANRISQADYGAEHLVHEINHEAACITRAAADAAMAADPARPRLVAGAMGPTNKTLSVSPDVNNPGFREVTFDDMKEVYAEQAIGLLDGGVDVLLVETVFDTLNAKAALVAIDELSEQQGTPIPVMVSLTITDLAGRNLSGQTVEAFWHSVRHARPFSIGLNCSFGAEQLRPHAVAIAKAAAEATTVAPPDAEAMGIGPVVSEIQFNKIQELIEKGIDEGADLVAGGLGRPDGMNRGFYVRPTVFAGVDNAMTIAREEIFGPVLCVMPYDDEADAIRIANDTPYGLSGYVQSANIERARAAAAQIRAGNVHINGAGPDFAAPFGGYKQSGNGREWGVFGFEEFLEVKAVMGYGAG